MSTTSLYHPISRPLNLRDMLGCLTPSNHIDSEPEYRKNIVGHNSSAERTSQGNSITIRPSTPSTKMIAKLSLSQSEEPLILSPPLSPYQRLSELHTRPPIVVDEQLFLSTTASQFKIENFKDYKMTIEPWKKLDSSYKSAHMKFISQYQMVLSKVPYDQDKKFVPRRFKRKVEPTVLDAESDSSTERVRTRRAPKPSYYKTDLDLDAALAAATPKKRRRNPSPNSPSLPQQQQMLIDETIPDLSPDANATLPANNPKCLKIEWKGQPMDLSQDPNIDKLHPAEVLLASILRLPALVYLDSKRRLFHEKAQRVKIGKQFRRTDAQKACRIDVNKASRLFAAFEKVGWLDDEHFTKYK